MIDAGRRPGAADVWAVVRAERLALVDDLWPLAAHRWTTPSLCPGWDVHDVVAHLVHDARTTRLGFVRDLVGARLDFDRANAAGVARARRDHPLVTLVALEAYGDRTTGAPAPLATRLVEVFVHGEDVRRPLGLVRACPLDAVVRALAHQARTSTRIGGGREHAQGFRLVAVDADLMTGDGPEVHGSALALGAPPTKWGTAGAVRATDPARRDCREPAPSYGEAGDRFAGPCRPVDDGRPSTPPPRRSHPP